MNARALLDTGGPLLGLLFVAIMFGALDRPAVLPRRQPRADRPADGDRLHRGARHDDGHRVRRHRPVGRLGRRAHDGRHRLAAASGRRPRRRRRWQAWRRPRSAGWSTALLITALRVIPFIVTLGHDDPGARRGQGSGRRAAHRSAGDLAQRPAAHGRSGQRAARARRASGSWRCSRCSSAATLGYTRFGRHLFAIGSNERTARLCGVAVERTKIAVYTIARGAGRGRGLLQFSRLSVGDPTVAVGLELDVIAAVIIGGGSLSGGRGTVLGTVLGATTMAVIQIGCSQQRPAELGAADRHRRDHRARRGAGPLADEAIFQLVIRE